MSKTMVENMLQPLPVSALFLFSSLASCPGLLTFPAFPIFQPVSYLSFTWPLLPVLDAVSAAPQPAEPVAFPQSVFAPLSLPLLVRLLVLRYFPHDLPSLCWCLFPLPLRWAPPSPCKLGTRQGNVERPGETDAVSSIHALRATLATSSKTW